jgi:hypothetical protein
MPERDASSDSTPSPRIARSSSIAADVPAYSGFSHNRAPFDTPDRRIRSRRRARFWRVVEKFSLVTAFRACRDASSTNPRRHSRHSCGARHSGHSRVSHTLAEGHPQPGCIACVCRGRTQSLTAEEGHVLNARTMSIRGITCACPVTMGPDLGGLAAAAEGRTDGLSTPTLPSRRAPGGLVAGPPADRTGAVQTDPDGAPPAGHPHGSWPDAASTRAGSTISRSHTTAHGSNRSSTRM